MSELEEGYSRTNQPYQSWLPKNTQNYVSPLSGQEYYIESNSKNIDALQKMTVDSQFRDLCPVWKPALPGTTSIFENQPKQVANPY